MIYCRHRICRSKLKKPVSNKREAFCSRGCHTSFYLKRCLLCEGPLHRRNKTQRVCRKSQCRNDWRARAGFGRYSLRIPMKSVTAIRITFVDVRSGLYRDERCTCGTRKRLWRIRRTLWKSHRKRRARELFGHDCGASYIAAWHPGEGLSQRLCCCSDQRSRTVCAGKAH